MHVPDAPPSAPTAAGALVIEADTAEEALGLVREQLGDDAEILEARKVHRGGWKGFFALERVELTARPRAYRPQPTPPESITDEEGAQVVPPPVRQRLDEEDARDRADFDRMLRRLLQPAGGSGPTASDPSPGPGGEAITASAQPASAQPEPAPAAPDPVEPHTAAPTSTPTVPPATRPPSGGQAGTAPEGVAWSCHRLEALRLPRRVVDACAGLDPADDLAWVRAVAEAVGAWCRPLPSGVPALVGPKLAGAARALGLPLVRFGAIDVPDGPVALQAPDTAEGRAWAVRMAGERWLHVVAAGRRWQGFVFEDALAVSWLGPDQLPMALAVAERLGLVLGRGPGARSGQLVRPTPVDVALAVRELLPRT